MASIIENLEGLERRFDILISSDQIQNEIEKRLRLLSKTTKLHGFRPGKIPLKMITQMYGTQVQQDVLNDAVHKEFRDVVKNHNLRVAGYPRFEVKSPNSEGFFSFSATFEVYPDIIIGDFSQQSLERPNVIVADADIDKTLEMVRKQHVVYKSVQRQAMKGDKVKFDYTGFIDGSEFAGGKGNDIQLVIGSGRFLKDFETALIGMEVGENKSFEVVFPEDYHGKDLAGKTATFEAKLKEIEEPELPPIDAGFAKELGIKDGDLNKLREGIQQDLEREVAKRIKSKVKEQVMQLLLDTAQLMAPAVLINQEAERLMQDAKNNLEARGMNANQIPLTSDSFKEKAEYRVKLGLILAELVKMHALKASPEQVRTIIEEVAQSYENPEQVIKWHYASSDRMQEAESLALEENVVSWVLSKINLVDKPSTFDDLMGIS